MQHLMAIDAGTGSVRAVIFDTKGNQIAVAQKEWIHLEVEGVPNSMTFDTESNWDLTVWCVKTALEKFKPDITVVAAGNASIDVGGDILMPIEEILEFIKLSPAKVIANHLEALNHCPVTREQLKNELINNNLLEKVYIPADGEILNLT